MVIFVGENFLSGWDLKGANVSPTPSVPRRMREANAKATGIPPGGFLLVIGTCVSSNRCWLIATKNKTKFLRPLIPLIGRPLVALFEKEANASFDRCIPSRAEAVWFLINLGRKLRPTKKP